MRFKLDKVPHTYALLFFMLVFCALLTFVVPSGVYTRVKDSETGKTFVDPESFHYIEQQRITPFEVFEAIHTGCVKAADIIFCGFIIGGAFVIIRKTGVMDAGINTMLKKYGDRKNLILVLVILIFSILGGTMGIAEETIVFIPLAVVLCKKLGLDEMVGLAIVMIGARVGFTTGLMNPYTVGVAQGLCELPLFSGLGYRLIWYGVILVITLVYVLRYANAITLHPEKSIMYGYVDTDGSIIEDDAMENLPHFTKTHAVILCFLIVCFGVMFWGIFKKHWYMRELSAIFLIMAIGSSIIARMKVNEVAKCFADGTKDMTYAMLLIGVARGVLVVLEQGQIIDTIIHSSAMVLVGTPK